MYTHLYTYTRTLARMHRHAQAHTNGTYRHTLTDPIQDGIPVPQEGEKVKVALF